MPSYTFTSGVTVPLKRVNGLLIGKIRAATRRRFVEEHGEPERPTYTRELAGGDVEEYEHDEATIQEAEFADNDELQAAWAEYERWTRMLRGEISAQVTKALVVYGVDAEPPDRWLEEQAYWGIEVPDDPRDCKFEWIKDASTGWDELMLRLGPAILAVPDPIEEAAEEAAESFRFKVEESGRPDDSADPGEAE